MAKLTAWLVTLVGVVLVLAQLGYVDILSVGSIGGWIVALAVLIVGIGKLVRNYKLMKKKR